MKKNKCILAVLLLLAVMLMPIPIQVMAAPKTGNTWIYDYYGVLTDEEEADLNKELEEISRTYGFEAVLLTSEDVAEDERMYAAKFMQKNEIGYGENHEGMILFHQPDRRNIAVVFRGDAQEAFDTRIQDLLLDDCTKYLKENDPYGAYKVVINDLKGGLARWAEGKAVRPMDVESEKGIVSYTIMWFLISLAAGAIPVFCMTMYQKGKMKTVVQQSNADAYIQKNGIRLDVERDVFVRRNTVRTKLPEPEDSHHSGGSSGGFSSGGEHFSGSSRNY